ncbi:hypothetical protein HJG60_008632 [Phyllostomus discolor]|uniref:Uncharacterized protein n=1 Tax=Phyllostomus discolor TaxID=89673 RepID=A0A833Z524_9CHIR|nr:hypothetical protein HJG60_008632 [Phyllostomus discolor]
MTHPPRCKSKAHRVLTKEQPLPWRDNPPVWESVLGVGQGVCKTLLTPHIALKKGFSHVTPGPRNSPREPQMAGYIPENNCHTNCSEHRGGMWQMPACPQRGRGGGMLGGNSSTLIKFLVKGALEEKAALDVSPTNRREEKQDFKSKLEF